MPDIIPRIPTPKVTTGCQTSVKVITAELVEIAVAIPAVVSFSKCFICAIRRKRVKLTKTIQVHLIASAESMNTNWIWKHLFCGE